MSVAEAEHTMPSERSYSALSEPLQEYEVTQTTEAESTVEETETERNRTPCSPMDVDGPGDLSAGEPDSNTGSSQMCGDRMMHDGGDKPIDIEAASPSSPITRRSLRKDSSAGDQIEVAPLDLEIIRRDSKAVKPAQRGKKKLGPGPRTYEVDR